MKILLIDDSMLSRNMLKRALGDEYEFLEAPDGMSGLEMYFLERPDLVILDLTMPGLSGMDVLAKLREMDPQARVVVGTADIQDFSRDQAKELGAVDFIFKPFRPESVREVIQNVLSASAR